MVELVCLLDQVKMLWVMMQAMLVDENIEIGI